MEFSFYDQNLPAEKKAKEAYYRFFSQNEEQKKW